MQLGLHQATLKWDTEEQSKVNDHFEFELSLYISFHPNLLFLIHFLIYIDYIIYCDCLKIDSELFNFSSLEQAGLQWVPTVNSIKAL